jgi:acetyl-CoA carboxylase carboxyl transferase subunit alpha
MNPNYLDFEQPIAELEAKIEELRYVGDDTEINIGDEISKLEEKSRSLTKTIFNKLDAWQTSKLARHPMRPYTLDYVDRIFTDFQELHGDRAFSDDAALVGGLARLDGMPVMIIGHQKGRDTKENIRRNFGMPRPEGYRKALRLMKMAERFRIPIITFIDTPGAYPGIDAEERNQSEAIARNLFEMADLKTPIICTVIGEGGSGGALAIGVGDRVMMLEYSTYSVISPEGCASILWKSADRAADAAEAMGITAKSLKEAGLIDHIIREPLGSAHRDVDETARNIKQALVDSLEKFEKMGMEKLLEERYRRLTSYGEFLEETAE